MENDVVKQLASDPGLLQRALAYTAGAVSFLSSVCLGLIWRQHNAEMDAIRDSINDINGDVEGLQRDSMTVRKFDDYRLETRADIGRIHDRIDIYETAAQSRHNDLMNTLLNMSERRTKPRD